MSNGLPYRFVVSIVLRYGLYLDRTKDILNGNANKSRQALQLASNISWSLLCILIALALFASFTFVGLEFVSFYVLLILQHLPQPWSIGIWFTRQKGSSWTQHYSFCNGIIHTPINRNIREAILFII